MTKYDCDTKLAAVQAYLKGNRSYQCTAQKMGVSTTMLKKWVAKFREHGVTTFQAQYTNYSAEFKMDVLQYIKERGASIEEAASVFSIPSSSTVWSWKYAFEVNGIGETKGASSHEKRQEEKTAGRRITRSTSR